MLINNIPQTKSNCQQTGVAVFAVSCRLFAFHRAGKQNVFIELLFTAFLSQGFMHVEYIILLGQKATVILPAVMRSWNIMATSLPLIFSSSDALIFSTSSPSRYISPLLITPSGFGTRLSIARAVVVFPAPVSPTSPRVRRLPI